MQFKLFVHKYQRYLKHFNALMTVLIFFLLSGCGNTKQHADHTQADGTPIQSSPKFTEDANKLLLLLQSNLIYPSGLNLYKLNSPDTTQLLKKSSQLYDDIAQKYPQDYYSAMRATELAIPLNDKKLANRNVARFVKRSAHKKNSTLAIDANYYDMLIGLSFLNTTRTVNAYQRLKNQHVNVHHETAHISQWLSAQPYSVTKKVELTYAIYLATTQTLWIDIMTQVGQKHIPENKKIFTQAAMMHPKIITLQWAMAHYHLSNHSLDKSIPYLHNLTNINPKHRAYEIRARKLLVSYYNQNSLKQYDKTTIHLNWLKKNSPKDKDWAHYIAAITFIQKNNDEHYPQALAELKKISPTSQHTIQAKLYSAKILMWQKKYDKALLIATDLDKKHLPPKVPNSDLFTQNDALRHDISLLLARLYHVQEREATALFILEERNKLYGAHFDSLYFQGMLNIFQQRFIIAEKIFRHLLKLEPDNAEVLNSLGYILTDNFKRFDEAQPLLEKANQLNPQKPHILDSLGWLYFHLKKYHEATQLLTLALTLKSDPEILSHLSLTHWKNNQQKKANALLQRGLKDFPNHPKILNLQKQLQTNQPK